MNNQNAIVDFESGERILRKVYQTFNERDIDSTLAVMRPDVDWPNGMEGGREHGHEAVRSYWTRQWKTLDPNVEPTHFEELEDGRIKVTVHQVVHNIGGTLLADQTVFHIYQFEDGLVKNMEITSP